MKYISLAILCITLAGMGVAQESRAPVLVAAAYANANMEGVPLKQALEELLTHMEGTYTLDPALDAPPYDKVKVSLRLQNADYEDALTNLLRTNNLAIYAGKGGNIIKPIEPGAAAMERESLRVPLASQAVPDLVTANIPKMPVKNALAMVWPKSPWKFSGSLGNTPMPGAQFHRFPRDMAGSVVVIASGLVPPTGGNLITNAAGKMRVSEVQNNWYFPQQAQTMNSPANNQAGFASQNQQSRNYYYNQTVQPQDGIAIAVYPSDGKTLYTILANRAPDFALVEKLLTMSGESYVMGNPAPAESQYGVAAGSQVQSQSNASVPRRAVTAQLRGVTLDQALDSILPACGMQYRKIGPADNLTYYIEPMVQTTGQDLGPPASSPSSGSADPD